MKSIRSTIICIMLTILVFVIAPVQAEASDRDSFIKVGLKFGSSAVESCILQSDSGFILGTADNSSFEEGMPLPAYNKLVIANEGGNVVIRDEGGTLLSADLGDSGCIMPLDYDEEGILYFENTPYRDGIMLLAKSNGTLTVINYITMEHYVYGVLNSELGYTNPEEALKAQAVAARSFAEMNLNKHSADGFDLCTGSHCQVYKGYSGEYPSIIEAVDDTKGEILYYDDEPVSAYYFKNSGGYTQNSEDVWSFEQPYLKSVKDEYCPSYPWSTSLSLETIRSKLEAAGYDPGEVESISIGNRNESGAVSQLEINGTKNTVCLEKEKIRTILGAAVIKSNMFSLGGVSAADSADWKISNGASLVSPDSRIYAVSANGSVKKIDIDSIYVTRGLSVSRLGGNSAEETTEGETVTFTGYGYGHGVGLPQDSAVEMAKQGFSCDEILKYYYTGIEIK